MGTDLTSLDPVLKIRYAKSFENLSSRENVFYNLVKKNGRTRMIGGKHWRQPIQIAMPGGGSSTFATALAATGVQSDFKAFDVTRKKHYRVIKLDNEAIEASLRGDEDSLYSAMGDLDAGMKSEMAYLNFRLYRGAGGSFARMTNSSFATTSMTIDDPAGVWAVRQGDVIKLSANADGSSLRSGSLTVASVTRSGTSATITTTANISTGIAAAAANDYIFLDGDAGLAMSGISDWCPDAAPSATLFYGVDRTVEPEYLGGLRVDMTDGRSLSNGLVDMVASLNNLGLHADTILMHPLQGATLSKQLEGRWVISQASGSDGSKVASIGISCYEVNLNGDNVKIYFDSACPYKRIIATKIDTWTLFSAGELPGFITTRMGSKIYQSPTADGFESRIGGYFNLSCSAPGNTCVALLP